jgi:hypothetical protein
MQIAEAQLTAKRAWHMQLGRCVLVALILAFVALNTLPRTGVASSRDGLTILWIGFALIAAYMAEQTWHAWSQLQFARNLTHAPTPLESEQARAGEERRNAVRDLLLFVATFGLISLTLRGDAHWLLTPLLFIALMPAARVGRSWLKLRRVSA